MPNGIEIENLYKLQNGSEAALGYFIEKYTDPLLFYAYKFISDKEASEEIVSEAFCKLWNGREKAVSVMSVRSFLYTVTRNACFDFLGTFHKKTFYSAEESFLDTTMGYHDVHADIVYTELIEVLAKELEKLPKQQAEVFRLSYLEGLNTQEICERLGTSASSVYAARSKALSSLKGFFKDQDICVYTLLLLFFGS